MSYCIGCDLGTSAIKLTLVDESGKALSSLEESYPSYYPASGYSEQDPKDWFTALKKGLKELNEKADKEVSAIAIDGQMHGLVALDEEGNVLRNAILWNDSRSQKECKYLNETIGKKTLLEETGNIAYPGFTLPKILWMKENEPELFRKIRHVLLPKDYLNYLLTGKIYTDYSDAAGTLVLDVKNRKWSKKMIEISGLQKSCYPEINETGTYLGDMKEEIAKECGFSGKVKVYQGAADNAAAAIGNGVLSDGDCNISLGTSGTIFIANNNYVFNENGAIHSFLSGNHSYCLLACMLSAASSLKWLMDNVFESEDYYGLQEKIKEENLGNNKLLFLPYMMGERSPINDPSARGVFFGLTLGTTREDMVQAVMEGVTLALKDSFVALKKMGVEIKKSTITGGGSKSPLWRKMIASALNIPISSFSASYGPSYGMALVCLTEEGYFSSLEEAKKKVIHIEGITLPDEELYARYEKKYAQFKELYQCVKPLYPKL